MRSQFFPLLACVLSTASAKLSNDQINTVFPDATGLTGLDVSYASVMDISITLNSTHMVAEMTDPSGNAGWLG